MIEAALKSGSVLKKYWEKKNRNASLMTTEKSDDAGLVTRADFESEKACVRILKKLNRDISFLTEEGTELKNASLKNKSLEARWILDPLDGTTNFVHGFPMFCVSLALEINHEVELGVIYHPILNDLYIAQKGKGAKLNGRALHVSPTKHLKDSLLSTGFSYKKNEYLKEEMKSFESLSTLSRAVRRPGSAALDLAYVARGVFDGFWERRLSPWDVAAGALLVKEAGGKVSDFKGEAFSVEQKSIVATNGHLHQKLIKML